MHSSPKFQEEYSEKIPALALLTNLGWRFISPEEALNARVGFANAISKQKVSAVLRLPIGMPLCMS